MLSVPALGAEQADRITLIQERPVKFLGRWVDVSLSDMQQSAQFEEKVLQSLGVLDKSLHLGKNKVWVLQILLLQMLRWTITLYQINFSLVETLEQTISKFTRKWLGFHKSLASIALYSKHSPCPLPLKSLASIFKSSKVSGFLQLRDSADQTISGSRINLFSGNWDMNAAVDDAESVLFFQRSSWAYPNRQGRARLPTDDTLPYERYPGTQAANK